MNNIGKVVVVAMFAAGLFACSDKAETKTSAAEKEHFMSEKMQTIKKAEAVNQLLQDAAAEQRRRIDEDS